MPSMLLAMVQGLVSCFIMYVLFAGALAVYAVARFQSGEMAWYTALCFYLSAIYITQVGMSFLLLPLLNYKANHAMVSTQVAEFACLSSLA